MTNFFGRAGVGREGKVGDDHGIFLDTGLFSFAPTGFGRRLFLRRSPVLFQNPHALTIGADRDMTAFGWGRRRFHLLIERLDILGQGQALTLRQIREKGKIENLIEAINGAAKILLRTRRV